MANKQAPESFDFPEGAAPSNPVAGWLRMYAKSDKTLAVRDNTGTETVLGGSGSSLPVDDTTSLVQDPVDNTRQMRIDVGGVATGTTRVATMPDADITLVGEANTATLANKTLTTPTIGDFSNAAHDHADAAGGGQIDASVLTYTPSVLTDWDGDTDPGDVDNALDQLAERVDDLEGAGSGLFVSYAILRDEKAANTDGGSSSSSTWNARDLNTELADPDAIVSISSNQFTPVSGTYLLKARAPSESRQHKLRLYNVTGTSTVEVGSSEWDGSSAGVTQAFLICRFTANGTDAYRIDHYTLDAISTSGLGQSTNASVIEEYLVVELYKEA